MTLRERLYEHNIIFNHRNGHDHDGVNSKPIRVPAGSVTLSSLSTGLVQWIKDNGNGNSGGGGSENNGNSEDHAILMLETAPDSPIDGRQFFSTTVGAFFTYDAESGTWFENQ